MPVPWETPSSGAPVKSGVPWEVEDTVTKSAYPSAEERRVAEQRKAENRAAVEKEQLRKLASNKETRRKALSEVKSKEELATAYGFKPEDFNPADLEQNFNAFQGYGYGSPQQKKGAVGSLAENAGAAIFAPLGAVKQAFQHGRAAISGSPESIQAKNLADLDARMYGEYRGTSTEDHPIASTVGTITGTAPWAMLMPSKTVVGSAASGGALGALMPDENPGNYALNMFKRFGLGAAGGAAGHQLMKGLITGGSMVKPAITRELPAASRNAQNQILEAMPSLDPTDITAQDINFFPNGVKRNTGPLATFRNIVTSLGGSAKTNERVLGALNETASGLQAGAELELAGTPFAGQNLLRPAAAGGDKNANRILGLTRRAEPGGQTQQASLELEQWRRQQQNITPAYDAIPPRPASTGPVDVSNLGTYLDDTLGVLNKEGGTSQHKGVREWLQVMAEDLGGVETPEYKAFMDAINKQPAAIRQQLMKQARVPQQYSKAPMNDIDGLMTLRENLEAQRQKILNNAEDKLSGSKTSHYLTEGIKAVDSILKPLQQTPEWQAWVSASDNASRVAAQYGSVYKNPLVTNLVKDSRGNPLPGDITSRGVNALSPDQSKIVTGAMEQRGQSMTRADLIADLLDKASIWTNPRGLQITRKGLLEALPDSPIMTVGTTQQQDALTALKTALENLDQVDLQHGGATPSAASGLAAAFSPYQAAKSAVSAIPGVGQKMLTNPRIKAMLLAVSATRDPALKGSIIQKILQMVEYEISNTAGIPWAKSGVQNPVDRSQFE